MKYATIGIVILVILGAAGFYLYSQNSQNSDSMMKNDEAMMDSSGDSMMDKNDDVVEGSGEAMMSGDKMMDDEKMDGDNMMESYGEYIPFTQSALDAAKNKNRVLFFYANWCPTCIPADKDFSANVSKFPEDLALIRVNYNDTDTDAAEKALAEKYGVTYQHTFVQIDSNGNEIKKWNGGQTDKLLSEIK